MRDLYYNILLKEGSRSRDCWALERAQSIGTSLKKPVFLKIVAQPEKQVI